MDNTATVPATAYSYLRFSSPEQAKGASQRRQIEMARRWAANKGLTLDETLRDEGISAFKGRQRDSTSALGRFLARVSAGDIAPGSYLLIESFDRLSREEVADALELFLSITRAGIVIVTLADGREYDRASMKRDSTQLIISICIMARAFEESETKSRRVGDAWTRKRVAARESRQAMTARCPGWIQLVGGPRNGHFELIENRAEIVREIFANTIAGDGRRTISKRLNQHEIPTWGVGGSKAKFWQDSYVAKVLNSPAVHGVFVRSDGERIEGYFPEVVSQETYWRAQAATKARNVGKGRTAYVFGNLLSGLAVCQACQGGLVYIDKGNRSKPTLRCSTAHGGGACSMRAYIPYLPLEETCLFGYAHLEDKAIFASNAAVRKAAAATERLGLARAELAARQSRLIAAIEDGDMLPAIRERLDALGRDIQDLDREASQAKVEAARVDETDTTVDLEARIWKIVAQLEVTDPEVLYRNRANLNARLRRYVRRIIVLENGSSYFEMANGAQDLRMDLVGDHVFTTDNLGRPYPAPCA